LESNNGSVRSLCGAGQVATILHQACDKSGSHFAEVFGLGLWRPEDTRALGNMLVPMNNVGKTPHAIIHKESRNGEEKRLFNLADQRQADCIGTTRIIRIYMQTGDSVELVQRVDWQIPSDINNGLYNLGNLDKLRESKKLLDISHIVIKDLSKGVVTKDLVTWLVRTFPVADWFISSKAWLPEWLIELINLNQVSPFKRDRVKLLLIPQLAIIDGIRGKRIPPSPWITANGQASEESLKIMDMVVNKYGLNKALIVALPADKSLLARDAGSASNEHLGFVQPDRGSFKGQDFVPMASVFLPTLVAHMIHHSDNKKVRDNGTQLRLALEFTERWMKDEFLRLSRKSWTPTLAGNGWKPTDGQILTLNRDTTTGFPTLQSFPWMPTKAHWKDAFSGLGVLNVSVGEKKSPQFHLWRAMTDVSGYVACLPTKRAVLQVLLQEGRAFIHDRSRPRSFMIIDKPGSGKSFLVNRLAHCLGMRFLSFNITQLHNRNDLIECFDTIVTTQAQDPRQGVLVFIDEINAKLGGQHVYDAFLAPLEDGVYVRAGKTFHIETCMWYLRALYDPHQIRRILRVDQTMGLTIEQIKEAILNLV